MLVERTRKTFEKQDINFGHIRNIQEIIKTLDEETFLMLTEIFAVNENPSSYVFFLGFFFARVFRILDDE